MGPTYCNPAHPPGDIETERLRDAAPTPGSGDCPVQRLRGATPGGSSLDGFRGPGRGGGQQSGSDTSLLAPESALRTNLRSEPKGRGSNLEALMMKVISQAQRALPVWGARDIRRASKLIQVFKEGVKIVSQ